MTTDTTTAGVTREAVRLALLRAYRSSYHTERDGRQSMPPTATTRVLAWYRTLTRLQGHIGHAVIIGHEPYPVDVAVGRAVREHIDRCDQRDGFIPGGAS